MLQPLTKHLKWEPLTVEHCWTHISSSKTRSVCVLGAASSQHSREGRRCWGDGCNTRRTQSMEAKGEPGRRGPGRQPQGQQGHQDAYQVGQHVHRVGHYGQAVSHIATWRFTHIGNINTTHCKYEDQTITIAFFSYYRIQLFWMSSTHCPKRQYGVH